MPPIELCPVECATTEGRVEDTEALLGEVLETHVGHERALNVVSVDQFMRVARHALKTIFKLAGHGSGCGPLSQL